MTTLEFAKVLLIVIVMITAVNTAKRLRLLIFIQTVSVTMIAAVTILKGRVLGGRLAGMLGGNYSNSNDLALAMVISLPLCLGLLFLARNRLWKTAWTIAMIAMAYVVFLAGSRGGFIALIITSVVCLWHFAIRGRRRYILALIPLVGAICWLSSGDMLRKRLNATFDSKQTDSEGYESSQQRQELFWRSIDITKAHPLFGVGPGNFAQLSGAWHESHNTFTQLSSEGGLPALILYVLILWRGFTNVIQTKRFTSKRTESSLLAGALHASLSGYIIGSVFGSIGFQFFPYILVAYTTVLFSIARNTASQSEKSKAASQSTIKNKENTCTIESDFSWSQT
jgi:O-antigen ligase